MKSRKRGGDGSPGVVVECSLCGLPIEAPKGTRSGALTQEQQQMVHAKCAQKREAIGGKYNIGGNIELITVLNALVRAHPRLGRSKIMREYRGRVKLAKAELGQEFPYLELKKEMDRKEAAENKRIFAESGKVEVGKKRGC